MLTTLLAEGQEKPREAPQRVRLSQSAETGHQREGTRAREPGDDRWAHGARGRTPPPTAAPQTQATFVRPCRRLSRKPTLQAACRLWEACGSNRPGSVRAAGSGAQHRPQASSRAWAEGRGHLPAGGCCRWRGCTYHRASACSRSWKARERLRSQRSWERAVGAQPASREGQPTARQSQPAPRWAGGGLGPPGEPRVGDEAEPMVWG